MAVTEQVVIAGIEKLRVFAHEAAQPWMIGPRAVLIEAEGGRIFACREQKAIVV